MKNEKKDNVWSASEDAYLRDNINTVIFADLCKHLGRTENAVNIHCIRLRINRQKGGLLKEMVARNMVIEMLTSRMGNPESFRYSPGFRTRTGIMQKRFWQLYRGEKNITEKEYRALCKEWNVTLEDAFGMGQLKMEF